MKANDNQIGGTHYIKHGEFQPWDAWWHWKLNAFQGAIVKYIVRYRDKGGIQDLKKARHYLDKLIELEEQTVETGTTCTQKSPEMSQPKIMGHHNMRLITC